MSDGAADGIRVLHVDDDPDVADLTATFLEAEDERIAVETAPDATDGLDRLETDVFDCVVSDYDMPGPTGIEFLEAVRAEYPNLPFILFTGKGSEAVASDAISAGVTDYLQKETGTDQYTVLANRIANAVEHRRTREAVERSERRLREIVDALQELLYVVDEDGQYLLVNETLASFHDATVSEIEGKTVEEVLGDDLAERFRDDVADVFESGDPEWFSEVEVPTPDGERRVFEPRVSPFDLAETEKDAVLGVSIDVTEREQRRREREQTNALLSTLFDTIPVGVLAEDASREMLAANQQLIDLFDLSQTPEDVVGNDCRQMARAVSDSFEEPERFVERIEQLVTERERVRDERVALRDGRTFARSYDPIELGDGEGHLWVYRDITERERRERSLERLQDATVDLVQAEDEETIADIVATAAEDILGFPLVTVRSYDSEVDGLVPLTVSERMATVVGERPTFTPGMGSLNWEAFEAGEPRVVDDLTLTEKGFDEDTPIRSIVVFPLGDFGTLSAGSTEPATFGETDVFLGQILASAATAAFERAEHAAERRRHRTELERKNERLEEFTSVVSHDLRSPLTVLRGGLELAAETGADEHFERANRAVDRMERMIDDLLTLSRQGETIAETQAVDLATVATECGRVVGAAEGTVTVETDQTVRADPDRLRQLVENLLRNALEHGGPAVSITVGDLPDGFYVADDGPGIPADVRDQVFDSGFSTAPNNTGFGLAIVDRIAEAHGWSVAVRESDRDGSSGARFEITGVETTGPNR